MWGVGLAMCVTGILCVCHGINKAWAAAFVFALIATGLAAMWVGQ